MRRITGLTIEVPPDSTTTTCDQDSVSVLSGFTYDDDCAITLENQHVTLDQVLERDAKVQSLKTIEISTRESTLEPAVSQVRPLPCTTNIGKVDIACLAQKERSLAWENLHSEWQQLTSQLEYGTCANKELERKIFDKKRPKHVDRQCSAPSGDRGHIWQALVRQWSSLSPS